MPTVQNGHAEAGKAPNTKSIAYLINTKHINNEVFQVRTCNYCT